MNIKGFEIFSNSKKIIVSFGLLIILIYLYKIFVQKNSNLQNQNVKLVAVETVERASIKEVVNFIGVIKSNRHALLKVKSSGTLITDAIEGELVKKGSLIAHIDKSDIENNYAFAKESEEIARSQYDRAKELLRSGAATKVSVEEKKRLLLQAQIRLSESKIALNETKIYAPFDGIVGVFKSREGSEIQNQEAVVNFYDPKSLIVEFEIPLSEAANINSGQKIYIEGKEYKLDHIQKMLNETSYMCPAYAKIQYDEFIIGSTVDVMVVLQENDSAIVIPFEAIFLKNAKKFVFIVEDNIVSMRSVTLGIRDKSLIEITSGLHEGDKLVVRGHQLLFPGMEVKIANPDAKSSAGNNK